MAGNDSALRDEVAELQALLAQTRMPGNVRDLQHLLVQKQHLLAEQEQRDQAVAAPVEEVDGAPVIPLPAPVKVAAHAVKRDEVDDLNVYTEISRFGWEDEGYGKDKVSVYVMSGIDGVGDLPTENVSCKFTKNAFDLKVWDGFVHLEIAFSTATILDLHGKNYRLVKTYLEKEINPSKSSFRVKKNRVTISLWKTDKNSAWLNLTEKNPGKVSKPDSSDPAAGIMDMMKNMYDEGDADMKRTIAKAWTESREKNAASGL